MYSLLKKLVARFFFISSLLLLLCAAWLIYQNDFLAKEIKIKQFTIDSQEALNSLPPLVTEPLRQTLYLAAKQAGADNQLMALVADEYIKRKPLDPQGWMWGSLFYQRIGDNDRAKQFLAAAHRLSVNNTPKLVDVFNRYLEMGLEEEALPVARDISYANPSQFRKMFYLMTRLIDDHRLVVESVIPKTVPNINSRKGPLDHSVYYRWGVMDAIKAKNQELALAVWNATPSELKSNSDYGMRLISYLASLQDSRVLPSVWREQTGHALKKHALPVVSNDFSSQYQPCWRVAPDKKKRVLVSSELVQQTSVLNVDFLGKENIHYQHISCLFVVEEKKKYVLSGLWRGDDITTLSGPFIEVFAPGNKKFSRRMQPNVGTWPWSQFSLEFSPPEGIEVLAVRIRRNKTRNLDNKISGQVSFKDFNLSVEEPTVLINTTPLN